jgi:hypothetical protein
MWDIPYLQERCFGEGGMSSYAHLPRDPERDGDKTAPGLFVLPNDGLCRLIPTSCAVSYAFFKSANVSLANGSNAGAHVPGEIRIRMLGNSREPNSDPAAAAATATGSSGLDLGIAIGGQDRAPRREKREREQKKRQQQQQHLLGEPKCLMANMGYEWHQVLMRIGVICMLEWV